MNGREEETRELVLKLEIAEAEDRKEKVSGKSRVGSFVTDEQLALHLHLEELQRSCQILGDDRLCQSITRAMGTDADILALCQEIDEMETADRTMAVNLSRPGVVSVPAPETPPKEPTTVIRTLDIVKQASAVSASRRNQIAFINEECTICMDPIGRKIHLQVPCGHFYDEKCLVALIQKASKDESMFPPRCCKKTIPQESFLPFLAGGVRAIFVKSATEFSTRPRNRVYCSNLVCSEFLTGIESQRDQSIQCPKCASSTCSLCRQAAHPGVASCKPDAGSSFQSLVEEKKWQACPECHTVIELTQGCYHITCRCTAQFCYLCTASWRTCTCPQWEERLLLVEAQRRVDAEIEEAATQPTRAVAPVIERRNRIERMATRLRENHACVHDWSVCLGAEKCSNCSKFLDRYLLRCRDCYIKVCVACARNRIIWDEAHNDNDAEDRCQ